MLMLFLSLFLMVKHIHKAYEDVFGKKEKLLLSLELS